MTTFTIELPAQISIPLGDTGLSTVIDTAKLPEATIRFAVHAGFYGALNNISRGKDDAGKANSDAVWAAMRDKRTKPWYDGQSWGSTTRETTFGPMRAAYVAERAQALGVTAKVIEDDMAKRVKAAYGDKEKVTFDRFLDALSAEIGKARSMSPDDVRDGLEKKYRTLAAEMAEAAKKVSATLDVSDIEF